MKIHLDTNLLIQQPRWDLFPAGEHRLFVSAIAFAEFSECTTHPEPTISDRARLTSFACVAHTAPGYHSASERRTCTASCAP